MSLPNFCHARGPIFQKLQGMAWALTKPWGSASGLNWPCPNPKWFIRQIPEPLRPKGGTMQTAKEKLGLWRNEESHVFLNPRLPDEEKARDLNLFEKSSRWRAHIWLRSSGTRSRKLIGLSKGAFMASAAAVNDHLQVRSADRWGVCLPDFHVGGLSIWARAYLSRSQITEYVGEWKGDLAYRWLNSHRVTILSLVPTQLFDLLRLHQPAPCPLRAVIVGGGTLDPEMYLSARELGWPILPSFGMTELCSQMATAPLISLEGDAAPEELQILPHVEARTNADGILLVRSPALMTGYWEYADDKRARFHRLTPDQWYQTEDFVELNDRCLRPLGRTQDHVKILGEAVHIADLERRLTRWFHCPPGRLVVVAIPDLRNGSRLMVVVEGSMDRLSANGLLARWNKEAFPPERLDDIRFCHELPRSALGKIKRSELIEILRTS
ncbi:MAG: hypothetical protein C5B49_16480 [Bdellovibrio sp.]|nr:MAG: hypothetical protein C5B49_16480 [Bdellovibrio sp.]